MRPTEAMSRRRALSLALFGSVGAAIVAGLLRSDSDGTAAEDTDPLAVLGRRYLETTDDGLTRQEIAAVLGIHVDANRDEIRHQLPRLRQLSRLDFATGDVVDVEQWVLARTEARAAALVALTPAGT